MKSNHLAMRPRWFSLLVVSWMLLGPLFLVLMTAFNGLPVPAGVPSEPLILAAFMLLMSFVYVLPVWLVLRERRYVRERNEISSFLGYAMVTGSISLLWGLPLLISAFST